MRFSCSVYNYPCELIPDFSCHATRILHLQYHQALAVRIVLCDRIGKHGIMQQHSGRVKSETDRLYSSASRTMDGSSMVRLALDAQTASQSGPTYCPKKIIPRSQQLAAASSRKSGRRRLLPHSSPLLADRALLAAVLRAVGYHDQPTSPPSAARCSCSLLRLCHPQT